MAGSQPEQPSLRLPLAPYWVERPEAEPKHHDGSDDGPDDSPDDRPGVIVVDLV